MKALLPDKSFNLLALLLFTGFAAYGFFVFIGFPTNPTSVAEVNKLVASEVPLGSTKQKVEEWLRSKGYKPRYEPFDHRVQAFGISTGKYKPHQIDGYIRASIRDTRRIPFGYCFIHQFFLFDRRQRLVVFAAKEQAVTK